MIGKTNTPLEIRLYDTLQRISRYQSPERMRKRSVKEWGVEFEECLEMAYENVLGEAERAIKGVRIRRG